MDPSSESGNPPWDKFLQPFPFLVSYPKVNWIRPRRNIKKVHRGLLDGVTKQSDDDMDSPVTILEGEYEGDKTGGVRMLHKLRT